MIASAVAVRGKTILESYRRILKTSGIGGTDYLKDEGGATTVFNMGVNGLFATLFVLAVKGEAERSYDLWYFYDRWFQLHRKAFKKYRPYHVWGLSCKLYQNMGD